MAVFVQYTRFGGPEVLEVVEGPDPLPGEGEVLVEVRAAGVNPIDAKLRTGFRGSGPIEEARRPGIDAAGEIRAIGDGVAGWAPGDAVIVRSAHGGYATHLLAQPDQLLAKPDGLSWEAAASIGVPVSTAYQAVRSLGVESGMVFLVHGASGSVGQAAIQFATAAGARVIGTAGARNQSRLRALGAEPVEYGPGLIERVRALAPAGVDRVLDAAGTEEALSASLELVADPAHVGTIVAGARADELGIRAWSGGSPHPLTDEERRLRAEAVPRAAGLAARGEFELEIGATFPLAAAADAHRALEAGAVRGKIILLP